MTQFKSPLLGQHISQQLRMVTWALSGCAIVVALIVSIQHIGRTYFQNFKTEYGLSLNTFGLNEGAFYLMFLLGGIAAIACVCALLLRWEIRFQGIEIKQKINYPALVVTLAVVVAVVAYILREFIIGNAPMTDDEHAYLFQAKLIGSGMLYLPGYPHDLRPFLSTQFIVMDDKVFSQYYPGFPLLLAIPLKLGLESLVNPSLAGLTIIVTYLLIKDLCHSKPVALITALLLATSPTFLFTSATLFSHNAALFLGAVGLWAIYRTAQRNSCAWGVLAAVSLGLQFFTRPFSAALVGLVAAGLLFSNGNVRVRLKSIFTVAGVASCFIILFFCYNYLLTGDFLKTTYAAFEEIKNDGSQFSVNAVVSGTWMELLFFPLLRWNFWALGWPLSFIPLFFARPGTLTTTGLCVILLFWGGHLLWPNVGVNITGATHYFDISIWWAALSASAIVRMLQQDSPPVRTCTAGVIGVSLLFSLFLFYPWAVQNIGQLADINRKPYAVESTIEKPAIVFINKVWHPKNQKPGVLGTWTHYHRANNPYLSDDVLWFNDLGDIQNLHIGKQYFKGRHLYRLIPSENKAGDPIFSVVRLRAGAHQ